MQRHIYLMCFILWDVAEGKKYSPDLVVSTLPSRWKISSECERQITPHRRCMDSTQQSKLNWNSGRWYILIKFNMRNVNRTEQNKQFINTINICHHLHEINSSRHSNWHGLSLPSNRDNKFTLKIVRKPEILLFKEKAFGKVESNQTKLTSHVVSIEVNIERSLKFITFDSENPFPWFDSIRFSCAFLMYYTMIGWILFLLVFVVVKQKPKTFDWIYFIALFFYLFFLFFLNDNDHSVSVQAHKSVQEQARKVNRI